ncbi:DNA translocase FtsK [Acetilactobacillus jinshanensis]|uniref:DNA translocase FtsK n=1 Tax=Acetilactobacillus jinshanensis TaxID=1720083 RepID=A0A4P6ZLE6_9LACO|nr:DNA translocase FtsK [Acetilactobacillus jinshanensis]QBP18681.1 DNA translocase FtsK [Acetilactobacillus jinshanensis]URL61557.1 DNA translocase FtsK [uncultured bacterium]
MNHYDGPAFYRKFVHDGTVNKNKKVNAIRERKSRYSRSGKRNVTGFSRDVQRANFNDFKPYKTSSSHIDLQNNPIARMTAEFKPRHHYGTPDQNVKQPSSAPTEFERINTHYQQLTSELSPSDDDVILLASSGASESTQRTDSLHFKLASSSSNAESSNSFETVEHIHSTQSDQNDGPFVSDTDFNSDERVNEKSSSSEQSVNDAAPEGQSEASDSQDNEVISFASSNSDSSSANNFEDSSEAVEHSESSFSNGVKSSNYDSDEESESSNSSVKPDVESSESAEPLGHDFSSIMRDEKQDIKNNLELFKKSELASKSGAATSNESENASNESNISESSKASEGSSQSNNNETKSLSSNQDVMIESSNTSVESQSSSDDESFGKRPDFVAQNPTNVQPNSDFDDSDSGDDEHPEIQPSTSSNYHFPSHDLLVAPKRNYDQGLDDWILDKANTLNKTLRAFHVNAQVVDWTNGPTVTQFQVKLHLGVKVSKINHLSDDLKMALAAKDIRIQAPIPGKTTCGIEIPNPKPRPVMLSEVVNSKTFRDSKSDLTIALGVDLTGKPRVTDLRKMPHGLIAGATGSGKSVFINCMLVSLMYKATPQELKMILIDPKAVEFAPYNGIPYLLSPVISEPKQAAASLKWATKEMNERYEKLAAAGVRNIEQFNEKAESHHQPQMKMPYILIVIDELADLMMVAGDEIETYIVRITQKARAAGIHLVVATQRPSVDVITGTMKNNIPTRVAFMVSSQVDSRTIIDQSGAERLLGKGDMLFLGNGSSHPIRLQGCYVSNQEIDKVAGFARKQQPAQYVFHPGSLLKHVNKLENQDKLMPQVLAYIAKEKTVSTSKLQRVFSIGYNRAAKIIDDLEQHNYISGQEGSKPRDVYLTEADYKKLNL